MGRGVDRPDERPHRRRGARHEQVSAWKGPREEEAVQAPHSRPAVVSPEAVS
jgi:hypothetical protein